MKIANAQLDLSGTMQRNAEKVRRTAVAAAGEGIELLSFPETALSGYIYQKFNNVDQEEIDKELSGIQDSIRGSGLCLVLGTPMRIDGQLHNSAVVLLPDGRRELYHKRCLTSYEEEYFTPGSGDLVFEHGGHTVGVLICRDQNRPGYAASLKERGARVIFFLSAHHYELVESRMKREKNVALPIARAYENNVFVCKANTVGTIHGYISYGTSMIVDPRGVVVARGSDHREEVLSYEADLERDDLVW